MTRASLLLLCLCGPCFGQHTWYSFNTNGSNFNNLTSYLRWTEAETGNVYMATQFYTGCSAGYFGGQLHSDGTHFILFSLWDYNATLKNSHGVSPWCSRFGGEGEGSHCGLDFVFEFGVDYQFTLSKSFNSSGALWSASVTKVGPMPVETFLGTIFIDARDLPHTIEECTVLSPSAISFQEYYLGGSFYSAANWRGPFLNHDPMRQIDGVAAFDASGDCGNASYASNVSSSPPVGPTGAPNAFFQQGGSTEHGCEKSMWRHAPGVLTMPSQRLRTRPTAVRSTGPALVV